MRWAGYILLVGSVGLGCSLPVGGVEAEPDLNFCEDYCTVFEALCIEANTQGYLVDCMTDCDLFEQGAPLEEERTEETTDEPAEETTEEEAIVEWPTDGNTIACRMHYLSLALSDDPDLADSDTLCPQAALVDNTVCVDPPVPDVPDVPDVPVVPEPIDVNEPPAFLSCANVTFTGCCTTDNTIYWCEDDALYMVVCGQGGGTCGWNDDQSWYDCRGEGKTEPTESHPYLCATESCDDACKDKDCGFHCGQPCGACGDGLYCTADNTCETCTCGEKKCGVNQCGQPCGQCDTGTICVNHTCIISSGLCMNETDIALYESDLFADVTKTCTAQCLLDADPKACGSLCY